MTRVRTSSITKIGKIPRGRGAKKDEKSGRKKKGLGGIQWLFISKGRNCRFEAWRESFDGIADRGFGVMGCYDDDGERHGAKVVKERGLTMTVG